MKIDTKQMLYEAVDGKLDLLHKMQHERIHLPAEDSGLIKAERQIAREGVIYCWDQDILGAVLDSTRSLPSDTKFYRDMLPTPIGWWWLGKYNEQMKGAFSLMPSLAGDEQRVCNIGYMFLGRKSLLIYAHSYDHQEPTYGLAPMWIGIWKEGYSIAEFIAETGIAEMEQASRIWSNSAKIFASFFLAGCLWLQQKIVERDTVPSPRAAAKRAARAGIDSTLHFIRLRKSIKTHTVPEHEQKQVNWSCRWIVEGHWRKQWFPGTQEHRPIWIDKYVKGPEDRPLKAVAEKVFVVDR